jgi:ATP-binding cassette subfamily C (CFTR/MRP) protein 1
MQIVKFFTYELPFLKRLREVRNKELGGVRTILIIRAANQAIAFSVPVSDLLFVNTHLPYDNVRLLLLCWPLSPMQQAGTLWTP